MDVRLTLERGGGHSVRFRLLRISRRGIATIFAGLIILSLILTAVGTMVFVSQQYVQYQQTVTKMAQYKNQEQSENLVANSPGLTAVTATTIPGWGSGCTTTYDCYNATISNLGGVGVQIVRIYITSTESGCSSPNPSPCMLNPTSTIASYAFNQAEQFLNAGEVNHVVILALPFTLPSATPPPNTVFIVTSRGNVFSFQWPFQILTGGQSQAAFSAGIVKVAYQPLSTTEGYDSKNEPGPVAGGSGGKTTAGYCHSEPVQTYPAGASYSEEFTGVNYANVGDSGVLWFVNPWVTQTILLTAANGPTSNTTTLYLAVNITNTGNTAYTVVRGTLDLTWYGSNHIDGSLIGIYYGSPGTFYSITSPQTITPTQSFDAIFRVTTLELDTGGGGTWPPANDASVMFWGSASFTNNAEGSTFVGGVSLSSGLWIPYSC